MKKKLFLIFLVLISINSFGRNSGSLFLLDEEKISEEFIEISKLENFVESHENITLSELTANNHPFLISSNLDIKKSTGFSVNRVTGDDEDKTMMYVLIGVGALVLLGMGSWLIFCLVG